MVFLEEEVEVEVAMVVGVKSDKQTEQTKSFLGHFLVVEAVADATAEERKGRHRGRKWEPSFLVFLVAGAAAIVGVTAVAGIHQAITIMVTTMDTTMDITMDITMDTMAAVVTTMVAAVTTMDTMVVVDTTVDTMVAAVTAITTSSLGVGAGMT